MFGDITNKLDGTNLILVLFHECYSLSSPICMQCNNVCLWRKVMHGFQYVEGGVL